MNITYSNWQKEHTESIEHLCARVLKYEGSGAVETAEGTAENSARAIGRLVSLLASKGLLTASEVTEIAGATYGFDNPRLSP